MISSVDRSTQSVVKQLGRRIRDLRTAYRKGRLTQEDLAERADISVSFLSMIERGERSPHIETLAQIASALEVELYELFFEGAAPAAARARSEDLEPAARALAEFARRHALTRREAEKLVGVAKALFPR